MSLNDSNQLKGKVVVVTGASKGIGRAFAAALVAEGAFVYSLSRSDDVVEGCSAIICDVSVFNSVQISISKILAKHGHIDILVNNAGVQGEIGGVLSSDPGVWADAVNVNVLGVYHCCRAVLPSMVANKNGKIINMSGGGATSPRPFFSAYAASKAAVVRFTETLAREVEEFGIAVNAIAPGAINTQMLDQALAAKSKLDKRTIEEIIKQQSTGGTPMEKPIDLLLFLASDLSRGISGRLISAVHDDWKGFSRSSLQCTDWFTLRRVDPYLFTVKR